MLFTKKSRRPNYHRGITPITIHYENLFCISTIVYVTNLSCDEEICDEMNFGKLIQLQIESSSLNQNTQNEKVSCFFCGLQILAICPTTCTSLKCHTAVFGEYIPVSLFKILIMFKFGIFRIKYKVLI